MNMQLARPKNLYNDRDFRLHNGLGGLTLFARHIQIVG